MTGKSAKDLSEYSQAQVDRNRKTNALRYLKLIGKSSLANYSLFCKY